MSLPWSEARAGIADTYEDGHPGPVTSWQARDWRRLLEELIQSCRVTETYFGLRVRMTVADGTKRDVEIRMTPEQWSDTVDTRWAGDLSGAARALRRAVAEVDVDERFLIWETYDLVPSTTPDLPADTDPEHLLAELRRNGQQGRWVAAPEPQPERRRRGR